jgi:hypothetical protein
MKKYILTVVIASILISCSTQKRYTYEAVNLQQGEISKYHVKCQLVAIRPTMKGIKHTFITERSDTIYRFFDKPLEVNQCYFVWKTKTEKNL